MTKNFQSSKNVPLIKILGFCLFPGFLKTELFFGKTKKIKKTNV